MKKGWHFISIIFLLIVCIFIVSCSNDVQNDNLWETAMYTDDAEVGTGSKMFFVEVKAEDKSVMFTVNTDEETVGKALSENNLIAGENGAYGLYVKSVNGIVADYNIDQSYWAFYKDGQYMQTGVDRTEFADGDRFELVRETVK